MKQEASDSLSTPHSTTKEAFVYELVKSQILSGEIPSGSRLIQQEIANRLSVSAIPVREAIGRLRAEGLVEYKPHQGAYVAHLSPEHLEEILFIRAILEVSAMRVAAPRIGKEKLVELRGMVEEMGESLASGDVYQFGALNKEFHLRIYEEGPYPMLHQMIVALWATAERYRSRALFALVPGLAEESHREHKELLDAIEKGDAERTAAITANHKEVSLEKFLKSVGEGMYRNEHRLAIVPYSPARP